MSKYTVVLSKKVVKQLDRLPEMISEGIIESIVSLEENPRPFGYKKLHGRDGYRIRYGNYRVIYDILEEILIVDIIELGHRKNIYK
jgi:mRNA interferase RelE/StbE